MNTLTVLIAMMLLGQTAPAKPSAPLQFTQTGNIVTLPNCTATADNTPCIEDVKPHNYAKDVIKDVAVGTDRSRAERLTDAEYSRLEAARKALQDVEQDIAKAHGVNFSTPCSDPSGIEMGFSCWSVSGVSPRDRYEFRGRWILINLEKK